ncbi:MAG: amidohydrolase, partial [Woeseiaceae bacterium]
MRQFLILLLSLLPVVTAVGAEATIIHNVTGYTSTETGIHEFSALAISDDGKVVATGGPELLQRYSKSVRLDGNGKTLLPGLTDAHAHVYGLGFLNVSLDLAGTPSVTDAVAQIEEYAARNPHADWILGRGWNQVLWPIKEFPTAADIDAVVSDRPVYLRRIDGHAGWLNTAALEIAGIDDDTPDPIGGKILRDENGKATGVLIDKAEELIKAHVPEPDKDDYRAATRKAIAVILSVGITSVHDAGVKIEQAEVYMSMADDQELDVRIYAMLKDAGANLDAIGKPRIAYGNDRLDIRSVKLYIDGALGSRGAALLEPYSDDAENLGLAFLTEQQLVESVRKSNEMGFQVGVHAIGDRGNQMVLNVYDRLQGGKPSPLRNRIEHSQVIALADIPRFAELGVVAAMQP